VVNVPAFHSPEPFMTSLDADLHRTCALSSAPDGVWLFAIGPNDDERVAAWHPGDGGYAIAPTPTRLTRGLGGGRFLSITDGSVEVVTVTVRPTA
jgi:hypothetical protein